MDQREIDLVGNGGEGGWIYRSSCLEGKLERGVQRRGEELGWWGWMSMSMGGRDRDGMEVLKQAQRVREGR